MSWADNHSVFPCKDGRSERQPEAAMHQSYKESNNSSDNHHKQSFRIDGRRRHNKDDKAPIVSKQHEPKECASTQLPGVHITPESNNSSDQ